MRNEKTHIAVLDVGRTNKKLLVYDMHLNQVDQAFAKIEETQQGNEYLEPAEDTYDWFISALSDMARSYRIRAISISTYGSTFVCIDDQGHVTVPVMSGATDPGEAFHKEYDEYAGDPMEIHRRMSTPRMPFLSCLSRGIFYVKKNYPVEFSRTKTILNLPQYFGFLLTGNKGIEPTYIGAHTGLWDFEKNRFSDLIERLGVRDMIPAETSKPWDILGTVSPEISSQTGLSSDVIVTMGMHDSNASLVPFLIKQPGNFMLVSTGSMCVVMNPLDSYRLLEKDLGEMVFCNLSAFGLPVKTALFVAGLEFDLYLSLLEGRHGRRDHPEINHALLEDIVKTCEEFILPGVVPFGMFMNSPARLIEKGLTYPLGDLFMGKSPAFFNDYERTYAILMLSMALHTRRAMYRAEIFPGMPVFIEGGFSHSGLYTQIIASLFAESPVMLTDLNEATALGAALMGLSAYEGLAVKQLSERFLMNTKRVYPIMLSGLNSYADAFERHIMVDE